MSGAPARQQQGSDSRGSHRQRDAAPAANGRQQHPVHEGLAGACGPINEEHAAAQGFVGRKAIRVGAPLRHGRLHGVPNLTLPRVEPLFAGPPLDVQGLPVVSELLVNVPPQVVLGRHLWGCGQAELSEPLALAPKVSLDRTQRLVLDGLRELQMRIARNLRQHRNVYEHRARDALAAALS